MPPLRGLVLVFPTFLHRYRPYGETKESTMAGYCLPDPKGGLTLVDFFDSKKHAYFSKIDTYGAVTNRTYRWT